MRLIDADELFAELENVDWYNNADRDEIAERLVLQAPTIDAVSVVQGEWIWHEDDDICNCSECEFEIDATGCIEPMEYVGVFRYCPNCGARMKGADDEQI